MTIIARMLKYLFWLLVVSSSVAILQRIVGKMVSGNVGSKPSVDVPNDAVNQKLVRDPICGMHVAEGLALPLKQGGEMLHFCSAECRDKYLNEAQKISASAYCASNR
jgi:YHS domain-containing protein